ncbi:Apocarotenoid-15,15'-oxygenase [Neosynechococcus sphagnicola sy1]|uniref:Apocarotenoid-15,15'-oxygenase n=1 Tax=Neosynechococcus sphagnicola sy1 TaxID=1497020 RepID=A0A098TK64_9CYAN|nr:carotenoid oxygenase family protein [Neosynechococcus sphagnicola]KGF72694.1 Apocarotenoid-15,15'-oxygenase [Neosynechococcus sphagnicola sy1]
MQTLSANSAPAYTLKDWQGGYRSQPQEFDYWIEDIEGAIPPELSGTLFRNGPGLLDVKGEAIRHPFDGDGMICAIAFAGGRAYFRNRFVRTAGYVAEQAAGKILYRGVFGTQKPGGWLANVLDLKLKNIANTHVIYWGGKLLALWEAAHPHRLHPQTLETLGLDNLDGLLASGASFAAHPRIDPGGSHGDTRLVNFAVKAGPTSEITVYEFDLAGQVVTQQTQSIPGFAFLHDFALTPNYYLFFQNPVAFNPLPYLLGLRGAAECIKFQAQQPTRILVIPRRGGGAVQRLATDPCFVFHHANAFEQGENLVVDSVCYQSFPQVQPNQTYLDVKFAELPPSQLWRFDLNLATQSVQRQCLDQRSCEFPTLPPTQVGQPYRYLYIAAAHDPQGNAPLQAILKLDLASGDRQIWSAAPRGFVGEPVFVPRPPGISNGKEDDGWLLTLIYDAAHHRSDLVILDAQDLTQGAIARLHLKHHVPYGLHGSFTPEWLGPEP